MKKKNLIASLTALSLLAGAAGASSALAANVTNNDNNSLRLGRSQRPAALSEAQKTEMDEKFAAVEAALAAGDYNAWVEAEKAINENCPFFEKVAATNFSQYAKAHNLRAQANSLLAEIGLEAPGGRGLGHGQGLGHGLRGFGNRNNQSTVTE